MLWTRLVAAASLAALSLPAQDAPRLPVEEVPLSAANLGIVSSIAADSRGNIYVLQRGDKADPVIVVNRKGELLRSWGKGLFTVPHSVRVDPEGNIWTADAGNSVLLKFSPE